MLLCEPMTERQNYPMAVPALHAETNRQRREHLLFLVRTVEFGGLEKHLIDIVTRIDEGVKCTILCYGTDFYSPRLSHRSNVTVHRRNRWEPGSFMALLRAFADARPSAIVLVKGSKGDFGLTSCLAARCAGIRRILAVEHLVADPMPPPITGPGFRNLVRRFLGWRAREVIVNRLQSRLLACTICVSKGVRGRLVEDYGYLPDTTVAVLNGTDLTYYRPSDDEERAEFRKGLNLGLEEFVIVCAARLSERKRIDVLLRGLAQLPDDVPPWTCVILGLGDREAELKSLASRLGVGRAVRFVGFVSDVRPFMGAADVCVSTSEREGLGLTLLEAMACGLPCIATNISGHDEVVRDGVTGILVPVGSPAHVTAALYELMTDPKKRKRLGENGRRVAEEGFDLEAAMSRIKGLIFQTGLPGKAG